LAANATRFERARAAALLLAACALLQGRDAEALADGYYDLTWAGGGRIAFQPDSQNASADSTLNKIIVTPSGSLLLTGGASNATTGGYWWLGELTPGGGFAGSFGLGCGGTATECQFGFACAQHDDGDIDAMLQADGKTLFVGYYYLSRTNATATAFDTSVTGGTGQVADPIVYNDHGGYVDARTAVPASAGKLYVAGAGTYDPVDGQPDQSFGVVRLNADLSIDKTFNAIGPNSDGVTFAGGVYINIGVTAGGAEAAFVRSNGHLLLIGRAIDGLLSSVRSCVGDHATMCRAWPSRICPSGHRAKDLSLDNRVRCQVALERRCSSIRHGSWQAGC